MKQELRFLTEQQFQNFASQLLSAELSSYQSIEGAGGDGGLDGLDGETAFQMYFAEPKNRTKENYIKKIDEDLVKLQKTIKQEGITVAKWIFVVPGDLRYDVVAHLQRKSKETGIECVSWGATKLSALLTKHPTIRDSFPEVFLPDVKQDIGKIITTLDELRRRGRESGVEIITDEEYTEQIQQIRADTKEQIRSFSAQHGDMDLRALTMAFNRESKKKEDALTRKKKASDRFYELAKDEINESFDNEVRAKKSELQGRGVLDSSIARDDLAAIEARRSRALERLAKEYGKSESASE